MQRFCIQIILCQLGVQFSVTIKLQHLDKYWLITGHQKLYFAAVSYIFRSTVFMINKWIIYKARKILFTVFSAPLHFYFSKNNIVSQNTTATLEIQFCIAYKYTSTTIHIAKLYASAMVTVQILISFTAFCKDSF